MKKIIFIGFFFWLTGFIGGVIGTRNYFFDNADTLCKYREDINITTPLTFLIRAR